MILRDFSGCRFALILAVLCLAGICGCSRDRAKFEELPIPTPSALLAKVQANQAALKDFEGHGLLDIASSKMGKSTIGLSLQYISPQQLRFTIYGPMGIRLGSMLLDGERYELSYGMPPFLAEGKIEKFQFDENFGFPISGHDIMRLFLPLECISPIPDSATVHKDKENRQFQLNWSADGQKHSIWIDPYRPVCTRDVLLSDAGDTLAIKILTEFKRHNGVHFPRDWELRLGAGETTGFMHVKLHRIAVNNGLERQDLQLEPMAPSDTLEVGHDG